MTIDLDPVCFSCYDESIKLVGLSESVSEMMTIFENKNSHLQLKSFDLGKCDL